MVRDKDFDASLPKAQVLIAETGQKAETTDEGNFIFDEVKPGTYTIIVSKDGYTRQIKTDVVISGGAMKDMSIYLSGEFTEMEEFIVQDIQFGSGSEAALLELRMEAPALMDSISSDLMSQAGASDAASALKLVAGTTVQDGKYAVVRGLPDRYVNSQMNGVRLPTSDSDKRAVQLDQFPSAIIESLQVTKTFTPDQQGDASGGAVNVVLKKIPVDTTLKINFGTGVNTNLKDSDWITYDGGGVDFWGRSDNGDAESVRSTSLSGGSYSDPFTNVIEGDQPFDYDFSVSGGGRKEYDDFTVGAFGSFYHKNDSSYYDDGINDKYWIVDDQILPYTGGETDLENTDNEFTTSLFDVTKASESVQWGAMGIFGIENENNSLSLTYLRTEMAEDTVIVGTDTRGKLYRHPDYDINDPYHPGNSPDERDFAPYRYNQTFKYTERMTETIQLNGEHKLQEFFTEDTEIGDSITLNAPTFDWTLSKNTSRTNEYKTMFDAEWYAAGRDIEGGQPALPVDYWWNQGAYPDIVYGDESTYPVSPITSDEPIDSTWAKPDLQATLGNFQRIWKEIEEQSDQYSFNFNQPFTQWSGDEGYLKLGVFNDSVERKYRQETLSNSNNSLTWGSGSDLTNPDIDDVIENNPGEIPGQPRVDPDVDYDGEQEIFAWYYMLDLPITSELSLIGGFRYESTDISTVNKPHSEDSTVAYMLKNQNNMYSGTVNMLEYTPEADADFSQDDILPSISFEYKPFDDIIFKGSYTETTARQTFKELSPILQREYSGGPIFAGNPDLEMSALKNYDLRFDWTPFDDGLISVSYFRKDIKNTIEYVQMINASTGEVVTTPVNYDEGELTGFELEYRQQLGIFSDHLNGVGFGTNATFIDSEVTIPHDGIYDVLAANGKAKETREMTNTPEMLYNVFVTWDIEETDTSLGLFYTFRGDTLVQGAGQKGGNPLADVYEKEYGTLNFSLSQKLGDIWNMKFQAKNLLNPEIDTIYGDGQDTLKESYTKGMEFSISFSATF